MPKRTDIKSILVIGSGPIVIGQGTEFDYSGVQACKVLKAEGYRIILVNSNPATIMTDPELADRTYIEPLTCDFVRQIIERERPDALLPTLGGQTALNIAMDLSRAGVLDEFACEMIGCKADAIERGENRKLFGACMEQLGLETVRGEYAYSVEDARAIAAGLGFPVVLRPSYTLGGAGGGIAHNADELDLIAHQGLELSPTHEVLIEESIEGWKEFEMEVMRDTAGNGIVVCSIENVDPMGVHTGDSITVAPAQTLTDIEYQRMRCASLAILETVGVETGGSNVQFAIHPRTGRMVVIEMNPRVSRSSALASKATGFPIAKAAARLAVGYTLDEILNDVTGATPACFEPTPDYCVVKVPRFAFEKFHGADDVLSTRMKAVGEIMSIGRTFEEAFGKAVRSLEDGRSGIGGIGRDKFAALGEAQLREHLALAKADRIFAVSEALARGWSVDELYAVTAIDPWFLSRMQDMVAVQRALFELGAEGVSAEALSAEAWRVCKRMGMADVTVARALGCTEGWARAARKAAGVVPAMKTVDTCAAEFAAHTAYHYKTYDADASEVAAAAGAGAAAGADAQGGEGKGAAAAAGAAPKRRIMILGAGPNRIGQGIEFDYCCVQASYMLHEAGFETIMVNCNPETVSTDYDTSDLLFFEPVTFEDVMDVVEATHPDGVIVTLGGQTPLKLSERLEAAGVPLLGTSSASIALAENRDDFAALLDRLGITYPEARMAASLAEAQNAAAAIGYPLLVRPSFVLGGRGMGIVYHPDQLQRYMEEAALVTPDHPVYLDRFLDDAIELDVDCLSDGRDVFIGGLLEHVEMAGIHSGDSASCLPPFTLPLSIQAEVRRISRELARQLRVVGLLNIQFAVKDGRVFVIEANPRASRTVPFVSKAIGVPLAKMAALLMTGTTLAQLALPSDERELERFCVKEAVLPFGRFPGADTVLGPEMKSTGEVMGIAKSFPEAYIKTQMAVGYELPTGEGQLAFISVRDEDKRAIGQIAFDVWRLGFGLVATHGTARTLRALGLPVQEVCAVGAGASGARGVGAGADATAKEAGVAELIASGAVKLIISIPSGEGPHSAGFVLRTAAVQHGITYVTTLAAAQAMVIGMEAARHAAGLSVRSLQEWEADADAE